MVYMQTLKVANLYGLGNTEGRVLSMFVLVHKEIKAGKEKIHLANNDAVAQYHIPV